MTGPEINLHTNVLYLMSVTKCTNSRYVVFENKTFNIFTFLKYSNRAVSMIIMMEYGRW